MGARPPDNPPRPSVSAARTKGATPARRLALEITRQVRERGAYAHPLIETRVRTARLPQAERDFAALLILGVVANSGELDHLIDRVLTRGVVQPKVRDALRISVYEMVFMQKEAHVVVSQGVELVRDIAPHASGFANKVLREIAKLRSDFPFGDPAVDVVALAHLHAFPLWLTKRLIADLGFVPAAEFMAASNLPAPLFVADLVEDVTVRVAPSDMSAWLARIEAGECIVTDASVPEIVAFVTRDAQAAHRCQGDDRCQGDVHLTPGGGTLAPSPCLTPSPCLGPFLEVGSGRGTKTVLLQRGFLRALDVQPPLFALDIHAFKQDILKKRIECYHLENVTPVTGDATRLDELVAAAQLPPSFGAALIDAPCSGTGTLRRHPEIRWRLAPEDITAMAEQGLAMLRAVARHIACGGLLLYSTCSVLREENEQVIEAFFASEEGEAFSLEPSSVAPNPFNTTLAPNSPDAHFAARLVKR
jgi:16S rRNA (cytosine967-C5)-methyltransferase